MEALEIFMRNVDWNFTRHQVMAELEKVLHGPNFSHFSQTQTPLNFHVHLHPDKNRIRNHKGTGALTLPSIQIGKHFLDLHGSDKPQFPIFVGRKRILFAVSKQPQGRRDVVERITLQPYIKPRILEEREWRAAQLNDSNIPVVTIQFGWECRDYVFSIECEGHFENQASLGFSDERREIRIRFQHGVEKYFIALSYSQIGSMTVQNYLGQEAAIVFSLNTPPTYERQTGSSLTPRHRLSFLPIPGHKRVAPYASLALRLVCPSAKHLQVFRQLCITAQLHKIDEYEYPIDRRELFSSVALQELQQHLRRLNWCVAFQVLSLVQSLVVDVKEVLQLMPHIYQMVRDDGKVFTATMLRKFGARVKRMFWNEDEAEETTALQCFHNTLEEIRTHTTLDTLKPTEGSLYDAFHVVITPTTMFLDGPYPERSNRVIRAYDPIHQESFLRVSFLDEAKLRYRFDREVDGPQFIHERVGPILLEGLTIAGRTFEFLAYSQSALKEHSVWFVKLFKESDGRVVNATSIIHGLGNFDIPQFESERLIYCPARYAARLSQAFTATDAVEVEVEEILYIDDITTEDGNYQFTDGVGTLSKELAREIWSQLKSIKRRGRNRKPPPSSYQIRFMGSKGMLSVDHRLQGHAISLRPSMIKFDAPNSTTVEIARAFDRPGAYFLNRPLIMLLEDLGIPYDVFKGYQDDAVLATKNATQSLGQAAALFESHGLGTSYRLSSVMLSLEKLDIDNLPLSKFYQKMLECGINHVLRLLKNHARIPVPNAWTLVGVADVHRYLKHDEIFACIRPVNGKTIYLDGPVLISRSPTIHPGDVMIVNAIGRPPPGTCFAIEPLANTVVFSVLGSRPVPSCLGGGDLDGDVYNVIPLEQLPEFTIALDRLQAPASYNPAPRKMLDRPSTMADVAEFVMEYINSDVVGIIAINWLVIADQSSKGIFDEDCIKLANLHSDAVDYPKSGQPVAISAIPKLKHRIKPDWNAPETVNASSADYYQSKRAIGRLFRAIDLPVEQPSSTTNPRRKHTKDRLNDKSLEDVVDHLRNFSLTEARDNVVFAAVEARVNDFIDADAAFGADDIELVEELFSRYTSELLGICASNTLSHARTAQLSEEEAIIGTIVQKTSQPRKRKDAMAKLREGTDVLVRAIREELAGDDSISYHESLQRAWLAWKLAWKLSVTRDEPFGAQSFGWVALGAIFEAIRQIEEEYERDL
ncbi:hypothetical protein GALMADRAFT_233817 [Galerina marginata CBS 339.88]|uniref:RNA-dependent RNA polymerase n=1 Tax=Galerina marginata (strain CBS 339.88) TaxID=685588 RepID=A0A067TS57_GALM3|nr:hypothetical protein GALMADRAFT_233817 [Galerina marginata CBS 339.88]